MAIKEIFYKNEKFAVAYDIIAPRQSANKAAFFLQRSTMAREEGREVNFWGAGGAANGGEAGGSVGGVGEISGSDEAGEVVRNVGEAGGSVGTSGLGGGDVRQDELKTGWAVGGVGQDNGSQRGLIGGEFYKSEAADGENVKDEFNQSGLSRGEKTSLSHENQPSQKLQKPNLNFATSQNEATATANGAELHCGWGIDRAEWLQRTAVLNGEHGAAGDLSEDLAQNEESQKPEMTLADAAETQNESQTASDFAPKSRGELRSVVGGGDLASAVAGDLAFNGVGAVRLPACGESCVGGYAFNGKAFELGLPLRADDEESRESDLAAAGEDVKNEFVKTEFDGEGGRDDFSQREQANGEFDKTEFGGQVGKDGFNTVTAIGGSNDNASAVGENGKGEFAQSVRGGEFGNGENANNNFVKTEFGNDEFGKNESVGEVGKSEFSRGEETSLSHESQPSQKLQKPNLNFATSQNKNQNETPKSHANNVCKTQSKTSTILILHGWGASRGLMKMAFKGRLDGFKQIYVDLAGFGKSTAPFALKTQDYANILQIFLNEIGVNVDCVIGHSFGGKVGVLLNPPLLVLLSSAGILVKKSLKVRLKISLFKSLKVFGLGKFYKKFASKDASNLNQVMYETFKNVVDEDFSEKFANFENKALIFWGKGDLQTPLSSGEKIHFLIKNSQFYPLDGDHFFFLTHTEFIGDKIVEFLACETKCENSQISYNTLGEAK